MVMKISFQQIQKVLQIYREKQGQVNAAGEANRAQRSDRISFSPEAKELQQKMKVEGQEPVREKLVQHLKREIEGGRYHVSGKKVAEKMLYRSLVDESLED
ncbi:MAG: flagellar biosynthesis anti-sigma factor FlgM [Halanaerobium sp.]|nr:flagellar biosynthesis anti-sigma factor FlgM [Halanaerobium sp.]